MITQSAQLKILLEKLISTLGQDSQANIDWFKVNEMTVNPDKFQATFMKKLTNV